MSGSTKMFLLLITLMACYIPEILSKSFCGTGNDFNICIDYVKCSDPPKLTLSVKSNNGEVVFEKKIPPSMEISVPGLLGFLKLQVKVEKEDGIATLKVALVTLIGSQDIISEKLYNDDCTAIEQFWYSMSNGGKIGFSVGAVILIILIAIACYCCCCRKRNQQPNVIIAHAHNQHVPGVAMINVNQSQSMMSSQPYARFS